MARLAEVELEEQEEEKKNTRTDLLGLMREQENAPDAERAAEVAFAIMGLLEGDDGTVVEDALAGPEVLAALERLVKKAEEARGESFGAEVPYVPWGDKAIGAYQDSINARPEPFTEDTNLVKRLRVLEDCIATWPDDSEPSKKMYLDSAGAVGFGMTQFCESGVTGRGAGLAWFGAHDGSLGGGASSSSAPQPPVREKSPCQKALEIVVDGATYHSVASYCSIRQGTFSKPVMDRKTRFWMAGSDQFVELCRHDGTGEIIIGSYVLAWIPRPGRKKKTTVQSDGELKLARVSQITFSPTKKSAFLRTSWDTASSPNTNFVVQVTTGENLSISRQFGFGRGRRTLRISAADVFDIAVLEVPVSARDDAAAVILSQTSAAILFEKQAQVAAMALVEEERLKKARDEERRVARSVDPETMTIDDLKAEAMKIIGVVPMMTSAGASISPKKRLSLIISALRQGRIVEMTLMRMNTAASSKPGLVLERLSKDVVTPDSPIAGGWEITGFDAASPADRASVLGRLRLGDIIVKIDGKPVHKQGSDTDFKFAEESTTMTVSVYTTASEGRPPLDVLEENRMMRMTEEEKSNLKFYHAHRSNLAIPPSAASLIGCKFTEADTGDTSWQIADVYFDSEYETYMAQYWDSSKSKPNMEADRGSEEWQYQPTYEIRHAKGLVLIELDDEEHDGSQSDKSDYELLREARVKANAEFLASLGLGPTGPGRLH